MYNTIEENIFILIIQVSIYDYSNGLKKSEGISLYYCMHFVLYNYAFT